MEKPLKPVKGEETLVLMVRAALEAGGKLAKDLRAEFQRDALRRRCVAADNMNL